MLARLAPRFVISRVIQTAYYADFMAVELTKQIIGESGISFYYDDPKKYFVSHFLLFRSAISMAISHLLLHPLNSLINLRLKSIKKPSKSLLSTTTYVPFLRNWTSSPSNLESSTEELKLATLVRTFSPAPVPQMRFMIKDIGL